MPGSFNIGTKSPIHSSARVPAAYDRADADYVLPVESGRCVVCNDANSLFLWDFHLICNAKCGVSPREPRQELYPDNEHHEQHELRQVPRPFYYSAATGVPKRMLD